MFRRRLSTPRCRAPSDGSWVLQGLLWHFPRIWVSLVFSTLNPTGFIFFCKFKIHAKTPNYQVKLVSTIVYWWFSLCSYPPPREKCAGPSCTNPYKYRDSKSKLPLCSLQCYKAMEQEASWNQLLMLKEVSAQLMSIHNKGAFFFQCRGMIIQICVVHLLSSIA
jgi:hypothetical protein